MLLVDSSVWIDWFNEAATPETDLLAELTGTRLLLIGDLVLAEVLQGFRDQRAFELARVKLGQLEPLVIGDHAIAVEAARNYRDLRALGVTVRKTIDTLIATRCIVDGIPLLYSDGDFEPFRQHLG